MQRTVTIEASQEASPSIRHIRDTLRRFKLERERAREQTPFAAHTHQNPKVGLRADMIRRLDVAPRPIDPMGSQTLTLPPEQVVEASTASPLHPVSSRRSLRSSLRVATDTPAISSSSKEDEFGGFPNVDQIFSQILGKFSPRLKRKLARTLTVPRTETLIPTSGGVAVEPEGPVKSVPYLSFSARVKRNSAFYGLTAENIEELGGVEYRALSALLWIIPLVCRHQCLSSRKRHRSRDSLRSTISASWRFPSSSRRRTCCCHNGSPISFPPCSTKPLTRSGKAAPPHLLHPALTRHACRFSAFQVVGAWANTGDSPALLPSRM